MKTCNEALSIVLEDSVTLGRETVELVQSVGRVLAEDIIADMQMPPFNKSAMDGYGCRRDDLDKELTVLETIAAGTLPTMAVEAGQCSKIMTGARVPDGVDCVVMVEQSEEVSDGRVRFIGNETRSNICFQGEDIESGDVLIESGAIIGAAHVATMAAMGYALVTVAQQPRVGVLVTGSELVEPAVVPQGAQIRDSNGAQLCAQVIQAGGIPLFCGIVADEREVTKCAIESALGDCDLLLISGGSSAGDWDFVPELLKECGLEVKFGSIAVKPGKPTAFAVSEQSTCFAMPGNPVSAFVIFELFVKPWIYASMGVVESPASIKAQLAVPLKRKKADRESYIPVTFDLTGRVVPLDFHGSAHISAFTRADGIVCFDKEIYSIEEGSTVNVRLI